MFWFLAILYIAIGSATTFFYKSECLKMYDKYHAHDEDTTIAIVAGIFWPVVAPLAFAILFAKKYANEKKDNNRYG